jgi:Domain of unknown function (DUF222)/HNH endonuclease
MFVGWLHALQGPLKVGGPLQQPNDFYDDEQIANSDLHHPTGLDGRLQTLLQRTGQREMPAPNSGQANSSMPTGTAPSRPMHRHVQRAKHHEMAPDAVAHRVADLSERDLKSGIGLCNAMTSAFQAYLLTFIAEYDRHQLWEQDGCHDMGQWLAGQLGITVSEGLRWTTAARALEHLPLIAAALRKGEVSFDKVLELARFATPETEKELLEWARRVSVITIRNRADLACRASLEETKAAHHDRYLYWSFSLDKTAIGIDAMLPAEDGSAVIAAIETLTKSLPSFPEEDSSFEQRCADALVTLCTSGTAPGSRPEVVLSADLSALAGDGPGARLDGGAVLHPETARRIACDSKIETVLRDHQGRALGIGRRSRNVPVWLMRELVTRDGGCSFPGCGTKRYLAAHHIVHWARGGATDLGNLTVVCSFHHKLVHEGGWNLKLRDGLEAVWLRPDGRSYEPRPPNVREAANTA